MPYYQIFPENTKTVQKITIIIEILRKHQRKVGKSNTEPNSFENKQKWVSVIWTLRKEWEGLLEMGRFQRSLWPRGERTKLRAPGNGLYRRSGGGAHGTERVLFFLIKETCCGKLLAPFTFVKGPPAGEGVLRLPDQSGTVSCALTGFPVHRV